MTIQQMLFGGYKTVKVTAPDANGDVFINEPAPPSTSVNASSTAVASGGTGSYTYSWTFVSGDALSPSAGTTSATCSWSSTLSKNTTKLATWRITVSDGVTSASHDILIDLAYRTNI